MKRRMGKCVHMRQVLSEEIEYFVCYAPYLLRIEVKACKYQKQKSKALNFDSHLLVPLCKLKTALAKTQDDYEAAELLDVDIETLRQAVEYYRRNRLLGL